VCRSGLLHVCQRLRAGSDLGRVVLVGRSERAGILVFQRSVMPFGSFCEAVGSGPSGENAAMWDGISWSAQPTAGPPSVVMNAISCSDVNSCEEVGSFVDQVASQPVTLAENWDGSTWALQPTPNPATAQMSSLRSVSCTSSSSCTAVGDYQFSFLRLTHTLGEVWNGTGLELAVHSQQ